MLKNININFLFIEIYKKIFTQIIFTLEAKEFQTIKF